MDMSVDGFIAGPAGDLDWLNNQPPPDPAVDGNDFKEFLKSVDAMVMGWSTFDVVVGFGPVMCGYGQLSIKVWTRNVDRVSIPGHLRSSAGANAKGNVEARSAASPRALFEELEAEGYRNAYVDGGKAIRAFLEAGLITRMSLTRVPILLGDGISLFRGTDISRRTLSHVSTKVLTNDMVQTTYDVVYDDDAPAQAATGQEK